MSDAKMVEIPEGRFAPWLLEPMMRNKGIYTKVALAAVVINLFALVTSLFTMVVYDRVVPNNATASLIALTIGLAIVIIFDFVLKMLRAYFNVAATFIRSVTELDAARYVLLSRTGQLLPTLEIDPPALEDK